MVSAPRAALPSLQTAVVAAFRRSAQPFNDGGGGGGGGRATATYTTLSVAAGAAATTGALHSAAPLLRARARARRVLSTAAAAPAPATGNPTASAAGTGNSGAGPANSACGSAWDGGDSGGGGGSLLPYRALQRFVNRFDPAVPVHAAHTAPAAWYTEPAMHALERRSVFRSEWLHVGRVDQLPNNGDFFSGCVMGEPFIVCRDESGQIRAHFNVCKHHAARLVPGADNQHPGHAPAGSTGNTSAFVCPYHGWTYGLDGRLRKATKMKGVTQFRAANITLTPIQVKTMGPLIFLRFSSEPDTTNHWESVKGLHDAFAATGYENLRFVKRVTYPIRCNWKVFVDNYLDGGLHVPYAHKSLSSLIEDGTYRIEVRERYSIQSAAGKDAGTGVGAAAESSDRLGASALYGFVYPNVMLNRYGAWLDTNTVYPTGPRTCVVVFDYFVDPQHLQHSIARGTGETEEQYIARCMASSDVVQREDMALCESVQSGLNSSAYDTGRYAPAFEHPMHQFHRLLHANYSAAIAAATGAADTVATAAAAASTSVAAATPATALTEAAPTTVPATRGAARALARSRQRSAAGPENAAPMNVSLAALPSDATPPATAAAASTA